MTDADNAYQRAQTIIAQAKANKKTEILFDDDACRALTTIPPAIAELDWVSHVDLSHTQISDLTPLATMTNIQDLYLDRTRVADLTPLVAMIEIHSLALDNTRVTDLTPLAGMTEMINLWVTNTQVADLTPLTAMTSMQYLDLSKTRVTDLSPLVAMTEMENLWLNDTVVADLAPLSAMTKMQNLTLSNTQVADLTPLSTMTTLGEKGHLGITFTNTPAAAADPRLGEISMIDDASPRARELLAYLNRPTPPPADQDDVAPMNVGDDGVVRSQDLAPNNSHDADQEEMRQEVLRKVTDLIGTIGSSNEWAGLGGTAQHYKRQVDRPLDEFKLNILYSAFNTLRLAVEAEESAQAQGRANDYLPPKIGAALIDLVQTHGLFYMGFPNGADIHAQAMSGLTNAPIDLPPEAREIIESLAGKDTVLDPEDQAAMQDDLAAATGEGPSASIGKIRVRARIWNMMGAVGRAAWKVGKWVVSTIAREELLAWVNGTRSVIGKFLTWAQGPGAIWFQQMLQALNGLF